MKNKIQIKTTRLFSFGLPILTLLILLSSSARADDAACVAASRLNALMSAEGQDTSQTQQLQSLACLPNSGGQMLNYPNGVAANVGGSSWWYPNGSLASAGGGTWYYPNNNLATSGGGTWYYPDNRLAN